MDAADLLEHLTADGPRFVAATERAGWGTPVPGLAWTVREIVIHTGAVHRWCADIVRRELATNETGGSSAFHPELPDDALLDWFAAGHRELVDVLAAAPPDLDVWTFARGVAPREFWIRRQAHELAIHRADVELAAGGTPACDAEFAVDGIAEALGFARERRFAVPDPGTLALVATDGPSWLITFGGERNEHVRHDHQPAADATVRGPSSDLYLWVWNRPAQVKITGNPDVAALWTRTVQI